MIDYGEVDMTFEKTLKVVSEELKKEGFGILTEIDVKEKLREKLGIDFKRYLILGACNPSSAHRAILAEENIGLMLPCNVIVYEKGDKIVVSIIRPTVAMQMIKNEELRKIAADTEAKLKRVFDSIK